MSDGLESIVEFDVSRAVPAMNSLIKVLEKYNATIDDVTKAQATKLNDSSKATEVRIQAVNDAFTKVDATLRLVGNRWVEISEKTKLATDVMAKSQAKLKESTLAASKAFEEQRQVLRQSAQATLAEYAARDRNIIMERDIQAAKELSMLRRQKEQEQSIIDYYSRIELTRRKQHTQLVLAQARNEGSNNLARNDLFNSFNNIGLDSEEGARRVERSSKSILLSWGSVVRLFTIQLIHQAITQFREELVESTKAAEQLSIRIGEIKSISQDANISSQQWTTSIRALSDAFGSPILETAEGVYQALSSQVVKGGTSMAFLAEEAKLATITVSSMKDAVSATTSIINAYDLSVDDAAHVNAVLFKTIELGHARLEEFSENLGKTSALSHELGISLEEQSAAFVTLEQSGLKSNVAMTLLNNVLIKLARPTKEFNAELHAWGVETGTAAIKTFGLIGVIDRMKEASEKGRGGLEGMADQLHDIRAVIGGDILTNSDRFAKNLDQFKDSANAASSALNTITAEKGKQLQIEMNKIRNYFTVDLGSSVLNFLTSLNTATGSLSDKIIGLTHVLTSLVEGFVAFKAIQLTGGLAIKAYQSATATLNATLVETTVATEAATGATALFKATVGGAASFGILALTEGLVYLYNESNRYYDNLENVGIKALADFQKQSKETTDQVIADIDRQTQASNDSFDIELGNYYKYLAQLQRANNDTAENTKAIFKQMSRDTTESMKEVFRELEKQIKDTETSAQKNARESEQLKEAANRGRFGIEESEFQHKLAPLGLDKRIDLVMETIRKYQKEANDLLAAGDVKAATERAERVTHLRGILDRETAKLEQNNEAGGVTDTHLENLEKRKDAILAKINDFNHKQKFIIPDEHEHRRHLEGPKTPKLGEVDNSRTKLLREYAEVEKEIDKIQERRQAGHVADFVIENRLAKMHDDQLEFQKKQIELQDQLSDKKAKASVQDAEIAKVQHESDDKLKEVLQELNSFDTKQKNPLGAFDTLHANAGLLPDNLEAEFARKREQIAKDVQEQINNDNLAGVRKNLEDVEKLYKDSLKRRADLTKSLDKDSKEVIGDQLSQLQVLRKFLRDELQSHNTTGDIFRIQSQPVLEQLNTIIRSLKSGGDPASGDTLTNLRNSILNLQEKNSTDIFQHRHEFGPVKPGDEDTNPTTVKSIIDSLLRNSGLFENKKTEQAKEQAKLGDLDATRKTLQADEAKFINLIIDTNQKKAAQDDKFITAQDRIAKALDDVAARFEEISLQMGGSKTDPTAKLAQGGMVPNYLAYGGFPGGPRGTDTIPAWLSPGEYVLDAATTKKFYPIIRALHQQSPIYRSTGGPVTNVGDINVTVQGGGTSEMTVRQIAQGLRRELKRGTIVL